MLVTRVSGEFTASDLAKMEDAAIQVIEGQGNMKGLILLSDFLGWAKSDAWGDVTFFGTFGTKIEKIAFVGDPKWRDEMFMFIGKGLRKAQVEFFEPSEETAARAWLRSD